MKMKMIILLIQKILNDNKKNMKLINQMKKYFDIHKNLKNFIKT